MTLTKPLAKQVSVSSAIPAQAGIGLRSQHHRDALNQPIRPAWLEVHSENYFGNGGIPLRDLEAIRADYPISLHGVGMSLGSVDALNRQHLRQLRDLIQRIEPGLVSEHLSWSAFGGRYMNDLLPLPYTDETLAHLAARISQAQDYLGRPLLIENPSSYLEYGFSSYTESEFLNELTRRCGCGILLDVNNLYVSCVNHGWQALAYLNDIAADKVGEIHLAGHAVNQFGEQSILIDTHNAPVSDAVWQLYQTAIQSFGCRPTLIEWDADLPPWPVLVAEAAKADRVMEQVYAQAA
ncbi:hypothetical protein CWO84_12260 [Methylomonas sp. Kb3]|uniref:MNIO family bufferin maturase n=1 Tax=Methylomonas sp. Kb3 TaxID=1611544 RepID=UPI000C3239FC|nr:DUF692 domain-containing protein [Methylomonas sp. Kb3]PKD40024.1 hypothetical protein CWO84_12260 [Methylomonas sp. Kb3]